MPCFAQPSGKQTDAQVIDLLDIHPYETKTLYRPTSRGELVQAIAEITGAGAATRAVGSNWSLSDTSICAASLISTDALRLWLSQPYPDAYAKLDPIRLVDHVWDRSILERMHVRMLEPGSMEFEPIVQTRPLIWVEAGVQLRVLLEDLASCGLALPTMGAGAGQSLAGMLSTSTHGADFHVPPLSSWLRAVHLVSTGGQEWWITGSGTPILPADLGTQPGWCPDTKVVIDDDMLDAVRVTAGRFGVIYAVVLEVVPQYGLLETATRDPWLGPNGLREQLAGTTDASSGIFSLSISRVSQGWLADTLVTPLDLQLQEIEAAKAKGDFAAAVLEPVVRRRRSRYSALDSAERANDPSLVLDGADHELSHLNIVISLAGGGVNCFAQRRWRVPVPASEPDYLPPPSRDGPIGWVIEAKLDATEIIPKLQQKFDPAHEMAWTNYVDIIGLFNNAVGSVALEEFRTKHIPAICSAAATAADALIGVLYAAIATGGSPGIVFALICLDDDIAEQVAAKVRGEVDAAIGSGVGVDQNILIAHQPWAPRVRLGPAAGSTPEADPPPGSQPPGMLDTHDYGLDHLQSGHSTEFHFDAFGGEYLEFIDRVIGLAREETILGLIGLRFTPRARAHLAMQQFDLTASVEVQVGRNRRADYMVESFKKIVAWGHELGGIPHWGQEFDAHAFSATASYPRLGAWRACLSAVVGTYASDPFGTAFSRECDLEPSTGPVAPIVAMTAIDDLIALQPLIPG